MEPFDLLTWDDFRHVVQAWYSAWSFQFSMTHRPVVDDDDYDDDDDDYDGW